MILFALYAKAVFVKVGHNFFGQNLNHSVCNQAKFASENCDYLIAVGSSLRISPANSFIRIAKKNGAQIVILNYDPTPFDSEASIIINEYIEKFVMKLHDALDELLATFKQLRDPKDGCPWDREQDFKSIASCSIEEAYEVADAIEKKGYDSLKSELGDLLFPNNIPLKNGFEENKLFTLEEVISELNDKLIRRHPHIFDKQQVNTAEESLLVWKTSRQKRSEKKYNSLMDDVPKNLPGLTRAKKLQKRAARVGFDWKDKQKVFIKLEEEINELRLEHKNNSIEGISEELGDVMFTLVNLCRHYDIEPEDMIRRSNLKFETRFRKMETSSKNQGKKMEELTLNELEYLWKSVK